MIALVIMQVALVVTAPPPLNVGRVLHAIAQVENWKAGKPGRAGEWGQYQITPVVWRRYSRVSQRAASPAEETRVATEHLAALRTQLRAAQVPETPYFIGLAWTAGTKWITSGRVSWRKHDYAERCANLYGGG